MHRQVQEYIQENRDHLFDLLLSLVRIDTANPPGSRYEDFAAFVTSWLKDAGLGSVTVRVPEEDLAGMPAECSGPRVAVIAELAGGSEGPTLCFQGHYDTVPPADGWSTDPLTPQVKAGRVYGLGATDMKGGIAAMMMACKALAHCADGLHGNVILALTPDEEYATGINLRYFLSKGWIKADYAIVGEYSGIGNIYVGMKGGTWGDITVVGRAAHGSVPHKGINAFEGLASLAVAIDSEIRPQLKRQVSAYAVLGEEVPWSTVMLGGIVRGSGRSRSTVPALVRASFDLRTVPDADQMANEQLLNRFVGGYNRDGIRAELSTASRFPGYVVPPASKWCQIMEHSVDSVTGARPKLVLSSAALETAFLYEYGVVPLGYGPGIPGVAHCTDEYVEIEHVVACSKVYALAAVRLLGN